MLKSLPWVRVWYMMVPFWLCILTYGIATIVLLWHGSCSVTHKPAHLMCWTSLMVPACRTLARKKVAGNTRLLLITKHVMFILQNLAPPCQPLSKSQQRGSGTADTRLGGLWWYHTHYQVTKPSRRSRDILWLIRTTIVLNLHHTNQRYSKTLSFTEDC